MVIAMEGTETAVPVRTPEVAGPSRGAGPLRFFISYKREDQFIADCLARILKASDPSAVCFFDQNIAEGNQWAEQINAELRKANRLILIYTGNQKNYETCVYEVATFQALHLDGSTPSQADTMMCLHDTDEVPTTFMAYQNCRVMTPNSKEGQDFCRRMNVSGDSAHDFYLASPCGQFLKRLSERHHGAIAPGTNNMPEDIESQAKEIAKVASRAEEIAKAFVHASDPTILDRIMYPRMWLEFGQGTIEKIREKSLNAVPDGTIVRADESSNALNIFGLDSTQATWAQIRDQCRKGSRSDTIGWMSEAEAALLAVIRDETVRPIELGFRSIDTRTGPDIYRCILTRRTNFRSGRQVLHLLFVRSRDRKLANDDAMAVHLALMVMTTRFRFEVLKGEWSFRFEKNKERFDEQAQRFLSLIEKAEYEANEFGIMGGLATAFSSADQKKIEEVGDAWEEDLGKLQKAICAADGDFGVKRKAILAFIETWLPKNAEFLEMVTASFVRRLRIDKSADQPAVAPASAA
jgi:hypothetical protein